VVRCTTIVTDNAVNDAVFANFRSSSLKYGVFCATSAVRVTPPFPPVVATVRAIETVCESVPLVPVTVTVVEPAAAVLEAESVSTLLVPVVVVVAGLKLAVTPLGRPLAVNETAPVKPLRRVMAIVLVPLPP
jgi:hypothetical protein